MRVRGVLTSWMIRAVAIALLITAMPGPAAAQAAWEHILSTGKLRMGVMPGRPPAVWKYPATNTWEGFNVEFARDVVKALSKEMGKPIQLDYVETSWATVVLDIQSNRLDALFGMSETEERKKAIDMAGPLYHLAHCYVNRKGLADSQGQKLTAWSDYSRPEVKVATVMGTSDEAAIRQLSPKATILALKTEAEAILSVQSGRADAYRTSVITCLQVLKSNPAFGNITFPTPIKSLPSSAGMRKDGDGRFHRFMQKWAEENRTNGNTKKWITSSVRLAGLNPDDLPPELGF